MHPTDSLSPQELQSLLPSGTSPWIEGLGQLLADTWQALLGQEVQCYLIPTTATGAMAAGRGCQVEMSMAGVEQSLVWELDRQLAAAFIDGQVGATEVLPSRTRGALTEIEQALIHRALECIRQCLNAQNELLSLSETGEVQCAGDSPSHAGSDAAVRDKDTEQTQLTYQLQLLQTTGRLTLRVSTEHQHRLAGPTEPLPPETLTAILAELELPAAELNDLAIGDIIATDVVTDSPITVRYNNGPSRPATLGRLGDLKAIQLSPLSCEKHEE